MKYKVLIGLEMHCEMKSNRKVFSPSKNEYNEEPNVCVSPVDLALPGTLPVVNIECVKKALKMAQALGCSTPEYFYFERKNYYYPDLPKGYQITQETKPIPAGIYGNFSYLCNGEVKTVRINNIHLEEDSANLTHEDNRSLINYNRCGVPLLELVTEPDMHSSDEAVAFLESMRRIYRYLDISEADTKKGQIRCDVNVSIMEEDSDTLGTRVEIKNVNSFGGVKNAIEYEIKRQIEMKENGTYSTLEQETRRWDEDSMTTIFMRDKKNAIDYKYFVDPNIPKFKVEKSLLDSIKSTIPELPLSRYNRYIDLGISSKYAETIIQDKEISDYFDKCLDLGINPNTLSNWLITNILGYLNQTEESIKDLFITPLYLKEIIDELESGNISSKIAKDIFNKSIKEKKEPKLYFEDSKQISNEDELISIIDNILANNEDNITAYKNGKSNLFQFFVGQVMKETKGKANPELVRDILDRKLNN